MAKAIYAQVDLVNYKNTVNGECVRGVHECFYDSYDTRVYIYFFIYYTRKILYVRATYIIMLFFISTTSTSKTNHKLEFRYQYYPYLSCLYH